MIKQLTNHNKKKSMKREIKFRAWDDKEKKWLLGYDMPNLGGFNMIGECMMCGEYAGMLNVLSVNEFDSLQIMQYTGLKDKNSFEIYEGDIIEHMSGRFEIIWQNGAWKAKAVDTGKRTNRVVKVVGIGSWAKYTSIIGNIYQHPHLLKAATA